MRLRPRRSEGAGKEKEHQGGRVPVGARGRGTGKSEPPAARPAPQKAAPQKVVPPKAVPPKAVPPRAAPPPAVPSVAPQAARSTQSAPQQAPPRARSAPRPKPPADKRQRRVRPRWLKWLWVALVFVVVVGLGAGAYFSPVLSVRTVEISAPPSVPEPQVRPLVQIPEGLPLLQVDTAAVAARIAALPKVAAVRVQRQFPSTLRVVVEERVPVAFYDAPDGTRIIDKEAVTFALEPPPPGLPRIVVDAPAPGNPAAMAALAVLASLDAELAGQVAEISAPSPEDIRFTMLDGRSVVWGGSSDTARKSRVLEVLLTEPGEVYDVSSPDLPTIR